MATSRVKVAVVTGGHPFDVQGFDRLFRNIPGIEAYIQHMDNFSATPDSIGLAKDNPFHPAKTRKEYEVVLFFSMLSGAPTDEGLPWYAGKPKSALDEMLETEQGLFVMHHAIIQYRKWPVWDEIVGIADRGFKDHMDQNMHVEIADPSHPITRGLRPFDIIDESYKMADAGPGSEILLTTDNPNSLRTLAWTRQYGKHRVFCTELGHDELAWANPGFRTIVERGIMWCARRI